MANKKACAHCGGTLVQKGRGLCWHCFADVTIRNQYPAYGKSRGGNWHRIEPTEQELEAVIAQQMQNLPSWWSIDVERMATDPPLFRK